MSKQKQKIISGLAIGVENLEKFLKNKGTDINELRITLLKLRDNVEIAIQSLDCVSEENFNSFIDTEQNKKRPFISMQEKQDNECDENNDDECDDKLVDELKKIELNFKPKKKQDIRKHEQNALYIIEGLFDGEKMISTDGKVYEVPHNYASKSKLVEGDTLKLVIGQNGEYIYKQIKPIQRNKIIGRLLFDLNSGNFFAENNGKTWKLLNASVNYFNGEDGDPVVFYIPKSTKSSWGAVESIFSKTDTNQNNYDEFDFISNFSFNKESNNNSANMEEESIENEMNLKELKLRMEFESGLNKLDIQISKEK